MSKAKWPSKVRVVGGDRIVYRVCPYCGGAEEFSNDACLLGETWGHVPGALPRETA